MSRYVRWTLQITWVFIAKNIYEKSVVLKDFIMSLGVNEKTAEADACRIEHVLSDESFAALKKAKGSVT